MAVSAFFFLIPANTQNTITPSFHSFPVRKTGRYLEVFNRDI